MLQQIISRCRWKRLATVMVAVIASIPLACRESEAPAPHRDGVRIASLVPAVTNMLLELDAADALVAVSNYDTDPRVEHLPRVGDLLSTDWEQLLATRPTHMVIQQDPAKVPEGLKQRATEQRIELVSVPLTRLPDVEAGLQRVGDLLDPPQGDAWLDRFRTEVKAAAAPVDAEPVPVLLALSADMEFVAGRENYLDDLLQIAGGQNVIDPDMPPYPTLDEESLLQLRPQRVIVILGEATPARETEAREAFGRFADAWGLDESDLTLITDPYAIVPGWSVIDVLKKMRAGLVQ